MNFKETGIFGKGGKRNHIFITPRGVLNRKKKCGEPLLQEHNDASSYSGLTMVKDFLLGSEEMMMDFFFPKESLPGN